jgi:Xaa-Pro dipeptidase
MPLNGERAHQVLQSHGVDVLIASSTENVYYISDYWCLGQQLGCDIQSYTILPKEGEPTIVAPFSEADLVADSGTWINDLSFYGNPNVEIGQTVEPSEQIKRLLNLYKAVKPEADGASALLKILEKKGFTRGVIALDTSGLSPSTYEYLRGKLPNATLIDGSAMLQEIRLVKTDAELDCIRRATEITEKSMEDALEIVRPDIMEAEMAGMFGFSVAYDGGQVTQDLIGFRQRSSLPNPVPSLLEARRGDLIRMTLGCTWSHYHSNISRTAVIGRASSKIKKRWDAIKEAQNAALDAVRPGARLYEVYTAAEKHLQTAGLKLHNLSLGHGIGVECNERPRIGEDCEGELIEGMVINIDIPHLELGWGGIQLEDTVLVAADGYELLTKTERDLYLL